MTTGSPIFDLRSDFLKNKRVINDTSRGRMKTSHRLGISSEQAFGAVRILFGLIWLINTWLQLNPAYSAHFFEYLQCGLGRRATGLDRDLRPLDGANGPATRCATRGGRYHCVGCASDRFSDHVKETKRIDDSGAGIGRTLGVGATKTTNGAPQPEVIDNTHPGQPGQAHSRDQRSGQKRIQRRPRPVRRDRAMMVSVTAAKTPKSSGPTRVIAVMKKRI